MQTIVTTQQPQDLLALVPALVGFQPHESIVLVAFHGKRTCGAFRFDLPRSESEIVRRRIVTSMMGVFCRLPAADALVPVVYTEDAGKRPPAEALVGALLRRADAAGYRVRDAFWVGPADWGSFFDSADAHPRRLELIADSPVHAQVSEKGIASACSLEQQATLPRIASAQGRAVKDAIDSVLHGPRSQDAFDPSLMCSDSGARDELLAQIDDVLSWNAECVTPKQVAQVVVWACAPWLRDILLFQWGWGELGGRATIELALHHRDGAALDPDVPFATALAGMNTPRPNLPRVARAIAVLRAVAAHAPEDVRAPVLTMLAWLHWTLGHSSLSGRFVEQARTLDPAYGLADLPRADARCRDAPGVGVRGWR